MAIFPFPNRQPQMQEQPDEPETGPGGMDDDFLSVLLQEQTPGTGSFRLNDEGAIEEIGPEDDLMPARNSPHFAENIADVLEERELQKIAKEYLQAIEHDIESRAPWVDRFRKGFQMMGLTNDEVDDGPFPGSSTAVMPIISEAVVQFWARSLAELVPPVGPCKGTVLGKSNQMQLDRAKRVSDYMNFDCMFLDKSWYADMSRMLFALPYTGSTFKKTYRDQQAGQNVGEFVQAEDFICNYAFSDLDSSPRYTHRIWRTKNQLRKSMVSGVYSDVDLDTPASEDLPEETQIKIESTDQDAENTRPGDSRHEIYEVYCELDLPGEFSDLDQRSGEPSGIALPYVVTIDKHSQKVLAIYRDWKENDPLKRRHTVFTKYDYVPGPGFYGYGLFHLIGGLQQAATGALRAIIDGAATASLQGGFISKDASLKDQNLIIEPGVWKQLDATTEDLNKAFFTPPFREPSPVLNSIMGFLVQRAEKFAATTEAQTGTENAKNAPVGSTLAIMEAGSKVFSTIHKGLHKALAAELRQRYELLQVYMPMEGYPYDVEGGHEGIFAQDFAPGVTVVPVSDPNIFSQTQRVALNQAIYDLAKQNPSLMKMPVVLRRVLEGINAPDIDDLMVSQDPPPPMDPVSEIQALLRGEPVQAYPDQLHEAYLQHYSAFMNNPQFGGNPMVQQQIGPTATALIGQRLAYAWAQAVRSLGVPAPMLPPPIQPSGQSGGAPGQNGMQPPGGQAMLPPPGQSPGQSPGQNGPPGGPIGGPPMGVPGQGPGQSPGQNLHPGGPMPGMPGQPGMQSPMEAQQLGQGPQSILPPGQQLGPDQLAQLVAQISPQLATVAGMPNPEGDAQNQAHQAQAQVAQAQAQKIQQDMQLSQSEAQIKQQTLALQQNQMQQDMALKQKDIELKQQDMALKQQNAERLAQQHAEKLAAEQAKAQREYEAQQMQVMTAAQRAQQEDEKHRQLMAHNEQRLAVDQQMAQVKAAALVAQTQAKNDALAQQASDKAQSTAQTSDHTKVLGQLADTMQQMTGPKKIIRDPATGRAIGVAPMSPDEIPKPPKKKG